MENIQVVARVRPVATKEGEKGEDNIWKIRNNTI